jgi:mRNA-degrading endonuclease RelE of RelBE toxin-antitoxin system
MYSIQIEKNAENFLNKLQKKDADIGGEESWMYAMAIAELEDLKKKIGEKE